MSRKGSGSTLVEVVGVEVHVFLVAVGHEEIVAHPALGQQRQVSTDQNPEQLHHPIRRRRADHRGKSAAAAHRRSACRRPRGACKARGAGLLIDIHAHCPAADFRFSEGIRESADRRWRAEPESRGRSGPARRGRSECCPSRSAGWSRCGCVACLAASLPVRSAVMVRGPPAGKPISSMTASPLPVGAQAPRHRAQPPANSSLIRQHTCWSR